MALIIRSSTVAQTCSLKSAVLNCLWNEPQSYGSTPAVRQAHGSTPLTVLSGAPHRMVQGGAERTALGRVEGLTVLSGAPHRMVQGEAERTAQTRVEGLTVPSLSRDKATLRCPARQTEKST